MLKVMLIYCCEEKIMSERLISKLMQDEELDIDSINNFSLQDATFLCSDAHEFKTYADENKKFIPNIKIMLATKPEEIDNFYKYAKTWKALVMEYKSLWNEYWLNQDEFLGDEAITALYRACVVLGFFQDGQSRQFRERLNKFITSEIFSIKPMELVIVYGGFKTETNGYNSEFAKFFLMNYTKPKMQNNVKLHFMERLEDSSVGNESRLIRYGVKAYNKWDIIKNALPQKSVLNAREFGSKNFGLTEDEVIAVLKNMTYANIDEDNKEMHNTVNKYGYSQEDFEKLQLWWNKGKNIRQAEMILTAGYDVNNEDITYEMLNKNNPVALVIGEPSCQRVDGEASSAVEYGVTKLNSGFVCFKIKDKIFAQAWIWYNTETQIVCLDNIELYRLPSLQENNNFESGLIKCLVRLAKNTVKHMGSKGYNVKMVTVGAGFNTINALTKFKAIEGDLSPTPKDYAEGYSDARIKQYIIYDVKHQQTKEVTR